MEKKILEKSAIKYFIKNSTKHYKILAHNDKPDFTLFYETCNETIGAEIAHLYYDSKEAKMLLRNATGNHGPMNFYMLFDNLIELII